MVMEASEWAEMVSAAVGIALSRQDMEVSESERSALDELIADVLAATVFAHDSAAFGVHVSARAGVDVRRG